MGTICEGSYGVVWDLSYPASRAGLRGSVAVGVGRVANSQLAPTPAQPTPRLVASIENSTVAVRLGEAPFQDPREGKASEAWQHRKRRISGEPQRLVGQVPMHHSDHNASGEPRERQEFDGGD